MLFGHTRTDPMRYFYRFATFVGGDSAAAIWEPWNELEIKIESTRVEPVFAFNRVFVFWAVLEENLEDPSSATITTTGDDTEQTVSSSGNIHQEVKVHDADTLEESSIIAIAGRDEVVFLTGIATKYIEVFEKESNTYKPIDETL